MADWLFKRDMEPDSELERACGAGRNVTVFDELRTIAHSEVREFKRNGSDFSNWLARCERLALGLNRQFPRQMALTEVRAIAKSVAKWTWKHFSVERFRQHQSHLGKKGMASRWAGHVAASTTKPWEAMGMSKATYYRRKKAGAL